VISVSRSSISKIDKYSGWKGIARLEIALYEAIEKPRDVPEREYADLSRRFRKVQ